MTASRRGRFLAWIGTLLTIHLLVFLTHSPPARAQDRGRVLGEREARTSLRVNPTDVSRALERVLGRSEFERLRRTEAADPAAGTAPNPATNQKTEPTLWERFLEWLEDFLERDDDSGGTANAGGTAAAMGVLNIVVYTILFVGLGLLLFLIARIFLSGASRSDLPPDVLGEEGAETFELNSAPGEHPPELYRDRARELADAGRFREAIQLLLLASLSWIELRGHLRWKKGLTNRDYARAIWRQTDTRDAFLGIVRHFDEVTFGLREADATRYRECEDHFRRGFQLSEGRVDALAE